MQKHKAVCEYGHRECLGQVLRLLVVIQLGIVLAQLGFVLASIFHMILLLMLYLSAFQSKACAAKLDMLVTPAAHIVAAVHMDVMLKKCGLYSTSGACDR